MPSFEGFLPLKMKGVLLQAVDKEVSALARLTFYANLSVY